MKVDYTLGLRARACDRCDAIMQAGSRPGDQSADRHPRRGRTVRCACYAPGRGTRVFHPLFDDAVEQSVSKRMAARWRRGDAAAGEAEAAAPVGGAALGPRQTSARAVATSIDQSYHSAPRLTFRQYQDNQSDRLVA